MKEADAAKPAEETKEPEKEAVKEDAGKTAEQPKAEEKAAVKKETSNYAAEKKEEKAAEAAKPADGEYESSADTSGSMFRVISSKLIVKDGKLKASVLLSGTGYDYLYAGTAEAAAADEQNRLRRPEVKPIQKRAKRETGCRLNFLWKG